MINLHCILPRIVPDGLEIMVDDFITIYGIVPLGLVYFSPFVVSVAWCNYYFNRGC